MMKLLAFYDLKLLEKVYDSADNRFKTLLRHIQSQSERSFLHGLPGALNCPINLSSCTFSTLDETEPPAA
jgi:hypothetical protein